MPNLVDVHIGFKIKQLREARHLSQSELAHKLELSVQRLADLESGNSQLSIRQLFELTDILEVPIAYFFEGLPRSTKRN